MKVWFTLSNIPIECELEQSEAEWLFGFLANLQRQQDADTGTTSASLDKSQGTRTVQINHIELPTPMQVAEFIESIPDPELTHTFAMIAEHFIGRRVDAKTEKRLFNKIWERLHKAQNILERRYHKKFAHVKNVSFDQRGRVKTTTTYKWEAPKKLEMIKLPEIL